MAVDEKLVSMVIKTTPARRNIFKQVCTLIDDDHSTIVNDFMLKFCMSILVDNEHSSYDSAGLELTEKDILAPFFPEFAKDISDS